VGDQAYAMIDTNEFFGWVTFSQKYGEGTSDDVTVGVQLAYRDQTRSSTGHNWHIHEAKVAPGELFEDCSNALGHWDPTGMEHPASGVYKCDPMSQTGCYAGE
jgi:hypothetical protein